MPSNLKVAMIMLKLIGLDPEKGPLQFVWFGIIILTNWSIIYLEIVLLMQKDVIRFQDYIYTFSSMSSTLHGLVAISAMFIKNSDLGDLFRQMKQHFWKVENFSLDKENEFTVNKALYDMKLYFWLITIFCLTTFSLFFLQAFFSNEEEVLLFPCYRPQWISYYQLLIYQLTTAVFNQIIPAVLLDNLSISFITLSYIQFKLLNIEIGKVFSQKCEIPSSDIKKLIDHHNFLLDFHRRLNRTFSGFMFGYIAIIVFSLCFEMYNVTAGTAVEVFIRSLVYTLAILFEFITLFCLPAQKLTDEAERLPQNIYFSNWIDHPEAKTAVLLMNRAGHVKVVVTAWGIINVNLETSLATVKTMVSYAMFLRTMSIKD